MNTVLILMDTLNRHYLQPCGCEWVRTPNMQRFADRAVVFERHFIGSIPCMPGRRDILTGNMEFFWRPWGPLENYDRPLARELGKKRTTSMMITYLSPYGFNPPRKSLPALV